MINGFALTCYIIKRQFPLLNILAVHPVQK